MVSGCSAPRAALLLISRPGGTLAAGPDRFCTALSWPALVLGHVGPIGQDVGYVGAIVQSIGAFDHDIFSGLRPGEDCDPLSVYRS